jgi:hypothetical protein
VSAQVLTDTGAGWVWHTGTRRSGQGTTAWVNGGARPREGHRSRVGVAHWNQSIGTRNHGMGEWWRTAKGRRPTWAEQHNVVLRRARSTTTRGSEQACGQSWRRTRGRGRPQ